MSEINKQKEGLPQNIALIICNGNPPPEKLLHQLWQDADYRVAADGGANQLYCYNLIPDAVVGDFDSIRESSARNNSFSAAAFRWCSRCRHTRIRIFS